MRKTIVLGCILSALMLLLPLFRINYTAQLNTSAKENNDRVIQNKSHLEGFSVLNKTTGEIVELSVEDYIYGVVAAEMPALYEKEALKAQAVAAYTYACRKKEQNLNLNYDISTDFTIDQSYVDLNVAKEKWGSKGEEYAEKIKTAVDSVLGYRVTYKGELANTVYHALSSGTTESCKDIWGSDIPYLRSVSSNWDKQSQDYITKVTFTNKEILEKLSLSDKRITEGKLLLEICEKTDSGSVKAITICGNEFTGAQVRKALELRSQNFEIEQSDGQLVFTVHGYGHGVGMSQYGANEMAKQGSGFKEILTHYYKGCNVTK